MTLFLFIVGLALLIFGAEWLIRGASNLALRFGISPLVVGLTIVAFGTSAPEIAISVGAALEGSSGVSVGNVVGSNIFNILFVIGLSALITPLAVSHQVVRQEVPVLLVVTLLAMGAGIDRILERWEGGVLFGLLIAYTTFLVVQSRRERSLPSDPRADEVDFAPGAPHVQPGSNTLQQLALIVVGLIGLGVGAQWVVDGAVTFARQFGISETVIGLTIVAIGTSLPEVATSVTAAIRGQRDIAVGNVVGSNAFNLLGCLGLSSIVAPTGIPVPAEVLQRDAWVMLGATVICVPFFKSGHEVSRAEGAALFAGWAGYTGYLVLQALG